MFLFLPCVPKETRRELDPRHHARDYFKAGMCVLSIVVGTVTLALSAVRLPGASAAPAPSYPTGDVVVALDVSVAASVLAVAAGVAAGAVLLRLRAWSGYAAASGALAAFTLLAGAAVTGINFWVLEAWAPAQPPSAFNETRAWEQDTAKAAGFGIVLVAAGCAHLLVLATDPREDQSADGADGRLIQAAA